MMSGQMIYTNKFLCISFAANSEIFTSFFFFFFFRLVLCYRACHSSLSVEIFSTYQSASFIIYIYIYIYIFFFFWGGDVCMYCRLNKFIYLFINFF